MNGWDGLSSGAGLRTHAGRQVQASRDAGPGRHQQDLGGGQGGGGELETRLMDADPPRIWHRRRELSIEQIAATMVSAES